MMMIAARVARSSAWCVGRAGDQCVEFGDGAGDELVEVFFDGDVGCGVGEGEFGVERVAGFLDG